MAQATTSGRTAYVCPALGPMAKSMCYLTTSPFRLQNSHLKHLITNIMTHPKDMMRPMWIWNTHAVISSPSSVTQLLTAAIEASVTDLYLYLDANHYDKYHDLLKSVNARASATGLRVWALEGGRVYLSDADEPAHFYKGIRNMIDFNARVEANERFVGISADLEPYARGHCGSFHNGFKTSELSCEVKTGVWKGSKAEDRAALMRDWAEIHETAKGMLRDAGLLFAAAFPHWTGDYCGEALQVRWLTDDAPLMPVIDALMSCVDYYVVMSYHVDPKVAATLVMRELECANRMSRCDPRHCPKVLAAVETTKDTGSKISYGDEPSKCSKKLAMDDVEAITATLRHHESFGGVAIHAWAGWCYLTD